MRKKLLYLAGTALLSVGYTTAQSQNTPFRSYCSTDSMTNEAMQRDPEYARSRQEFIKYVQSLNSQAIARLNSAPQYTIPIVVHIIHTYGADNISDAQVYDAVRIINEDFQKRNADTANIALVYQPLNANVGFQFRLARKDPNGNCTNGITRTYSNLTNSASDNVKALVDWDPTKYLNIWVVDNIASGAGGYSYLPCGVSQSIEGVVVRNSQFGSIGQSGGSNLAKRSLTHEIGHYMGLPHVWGGSNTPGAAGNCSMDDGISDTPNTKGSATQNCDLNAYTCNPTTYPFPDNVQNYMDYSNCGSMYTSGQKAVMVGALSMPCRSNLTTAANLLATGTNDGYTATCAPIADFSSSSVSVCAGNTVSFSDQSYNLVSGSTPTYQWSFPGGTPATSTSANPIVTYNTPGVYNVTLTTTNSTGPSSITKNSVITVRPTTSAEVAPYSEGFETADFPTHSSNPQKSWEIIKPTSTGWEASPAAAATGLNSVRLRNSSIPAGTITSLISPAINMTNVSGATLRYKVAYSQKTTSSSDKLTVSISKDCGSTWVTRSTKTGSGLSTTGTLISGNFIPSASQWRQETIILPGGFLVNNMLVKFEGTTGTAGNTLYLDDIELTGTVLGLNNEVNANVALNIFPNPSNGDASVNFALPASADYKLEIFTVTGQQVGKTLSRRSTGKAEEMKLSEVAGQQLKPGVYLIKMQTNGYSTQKKAIVF